MWKAIKDHKALYMMLLLPVIFFAVFCYWPMYGVQIAFKDYSPAFGITGSPWVGFQQYHRFFNSYYFWNLIQNTLGISLYNILIGIPLPVIMAILFNEIRKKRLKGILQTVSYAPNFISIVVTAGIILFFLNSQSGVINTILKHLGMAPVEFMGNSSYFWHIIVWSDMWQYAGWSSLIYTAAIASISVDQYEAAYMDGANKFQRILYITLPNLLPTIIILSILALGNVMTVGFEKILLLQNDVNAERSEVISTYVYKSGIIQAQYSYAAAVGLFNNVVNFVILVIANIAARKTTKTSLW